MTETVVPVVVEEPAKEVAPKEVVEEKKPASTEAVAEAPAADEKPAAAGACRCPASRRASCCTEQRGLNFLNPSQPARLRLCTNDC